MMETMNPQTVGGPLPRNSRQILDAAVLTAFQRCRRESLLSREWMGYRWDPHKLFNSALRSAIVTLSGGLKGPIDGETAASMARAQFYDKAAKPGLNLPGDQVYLAAKEWICMLQVVIRSIAKLNLPVLHPMPNVPLMHDAEWRFLSLGVDDSGTLHRWITVDRWSDEALTREMHSWYVMGDIAMARTPMQIHVVVLGPLRDGRHRSHWARRWKDKRLPNLHAHFLGRNGQPMRGEPEYLVDQPVPDYEQWVEQMWAEGAVRGLFHHHMINCPADRVLDDTLQQIRSEYLERKNTFASDMHWHEMPMSRGACHWIGGRCLFVDLCHRDPQVEPGELGLYIERRKAKDSGILAGTGGRL